MPSAQPFQLTPGFQGCTYPQLARLLNVNTGELIKRADLASISYIVFNSAGQQVATGTFTIASVIFDTLQTGGLWETDNTGYNYSAPFPAACFAVSDQYQLQTIFTQADGGIFPLLTQAFMIGLMPATTTTTTTTSTTTTTT